MKAKALFAATAAALALIERGTAAAQTTLRIGLAEDPDVLDPTLARTYVGRIVFASICDKLFDIDEKLNVVPQLALSHETSADGKTVTIKLRPGVKFHDGEPFDAEAAKYSLERHLTMQGSFRKPELAAVDSVEVVDPLTIRLVLKAPFSPLIAQLTDRAGMMVSPKAAKEAGDKFGLQAGLRRPLQVRRARAAGPHRGREVRRLLEQGQRPHRPHRLPADRRLHGAARQPQVGRARPDRARARDRHQGRARRPASSSSRPRSSSAIRASTINVANGEQAEEPARQRSPRCARRSSLAIDRDALEPGRVQRRIRAGQPVGQPGEPVLPDRLPDAQARRRQGQGADQGGRRRRRRSTSTSWCRRAPRRRRSPR